MIAEICYTLFIWPIRFILEFLFVLFIRIFDAPGASVIFLSIVVNTLSLPIYTIADRWQREERELQKRMKKKLAAIRTHFRGDERQMITNAYYRQTGYSPVFILKASAGLLLQIPFFIAAYGFLSRTSLLSGASFLFLHSLNEPDALLRLPLSFEGITAVNVLPFIMTAINLLSSFIYAKNLGKRELVQLFAMALVFLALLYKSPSGLVLYWTMNNLYSLVKNAAAAALKKPGRVLQIAAAAAAGFLLFFIWSGRASVERYRMLFSFIALGFVIFPLAWKMLLRIFCRMESRDPLALRDEGMLYYSSAFLLFLLMGLLNPLQVLSASVSDFETPWLFFRRTFFEGAAFFFLIPLFIRALAPAKVRPVLAALSAVLSLSSLAFYFVFSKSYGVMDRNFRLDDTERLLHAFPPWVSIAVPLAAAAVSAAVIAFKKIRPLAFLFRAAAAAVIVLSVMDMVSLGRQSAELARLSETADGLQGRESAETSGFPAVFPLSRTAPNVFIVFFDRAQGTAMTDALEYMPALRDELDGFTFYPNTLSLGSCTVTGVPAMLGGYRYMPLAINERKDELLKDKVNEALTLLPRLFGAAGYRVSITDPVIANLQSVPDISIFRDLPNVSARVLSGKLSARFRAEFPSGDTEGADAFDFDILFRYGIFRASPPALRYGIHYKGQWWREAAYNSYGRAAAEFSSLYYLPDLCPVMDEGGGTPVSSGTLNIFMNAVTHEAGAYGADYFPRHEPAVFSDDETARFGSAGNAEYMHAFLAAMKQFVKWLDYLKAEGVYDNTRIILVSDHGGHYSGKHVEFNGMEGYNPILMVKETEKRGPLEISETFMTHADTPYLAARNMPGLAIGAEAMKDMENAVWEKMKAGTLYAVSEVSSQPLRHGPYGFNLEGKRALKGRAMFRKESWGDWEKEQGL